MQELFQNALNGVSFYLKPSLAAHSHQRQKEKMRVSIEAVDIHSLLIEFLSEVVARSDNENMVFTGVSFDDFGENFLEGEFSGIRADTFDREIKAISYRETDIKKNPETGFFETVLVCDV